MRFLVDQPVSPALASLLVKQGHDAVHVRERGLSSASDEELFALAVAEQRILVTADLDFGRLAVLSGRSTPGVVLFRGEALTDRQMGELLQHVLVRVAPDDIEHAIVVAAPGVVRVARLPLRPDLH